MVLHEGEEQNAPSGVLPVPTAGKQSTQSLQQAPLHRRGIILLWTVPASSLRTERMLNRVALSGHFCSSRLAGNGASNRLLHGAIVVVLNLRVVGSFPVDEHADADEDVVSFRSRD